MIIETPTVETPEVDAPADAEPTSSSITAAGAELKAMGDTWEVPSGDASAPETPAEGTEAEERAAEQPDALAGFQLDAEGRLHRADGTYASAEEVETWNQSATPTEQPQVAEATPEPIVVTLRGRDGNEVEIEVDDEAAAEVLRTNHREGLRAQEYNKRMAQVQEKEAQFREFETMLETNPESVILQHLPVEKQVSLAVALLAQHWDQLAPHLVKFDTEPGTRIAEAANARVRMTEQERTYEQRVQSARYATQVESAVRALVPESADEATANAFMQDAGIDLGNAIRARNGAPVPIEEVKQVLTRRLALYGFDKPAAPQVSAESTKPKRPLAKPVAPAPQAAAPKPDAGAQVRRTVTAQRIAAAVPPQGAGAATVRAPLQPPTATVSDASKSLRTAKSWADVR